MSNVKKLTLKSTEFPEILRQIPSPPKELYVLGDLAPLLERPRVAMVGSRKVTPYGRQVTQQLARDLANAGVVIISGLALGVDAIAHQAALEAGGLCIAVLPTSVEDIAPRSNVQLAKNILAHGGVLISEYPADLPPQRLNFIARNRLVSGLSDGVLITEAALKSGTLHTANFALNQGKTVMAVPGNITSFGSQGTNSLIKAGALPITEVSDVLSTLHIDTPGMQKQLPLGTNREEQLILDLIMDGISDGAILLARSGLSPSEFNQTLTMLEITGKIRPLGAGHWGIQ